MLLCMKQSSCAKHENIECSKSLKPKRRCRRGSGCSRVRAVVAYQAVQQLSSLSWSLMLLAKRCSAVFDMHVMAFDSNGNGTRASAVERNIARW